MEALLNRVEQKLYLERVARNRRQWLINLWPSKYWHESVLMRGQTGVPGEKQISTFIQISFSQKKQSKKKKHKTKQNKKQRNSCMDAGFV